MTSRPIRLDPRGPGSSGMTPIALDPAGFLTPLPRQHWDIQFSDPAIGLTVGVWDTITMQEAPGPYPGDEVILVLEGAFAMVDGEGRGTLAEAGQSVVFRNGTPTSWLQPGYLKKFCRSSACCCRIRRPRPPGAPAPKPGSSCSTRARNCPTPMQRPSRRSARRSATGRSLPMTRA